MDPAIVLEGLGLEKKESVAYLGLLELGQATPLELSRKTRIKRPTTYLILESLIQKGLAARVGKERTTLYIPQRPETLRADVEARLKDFDAILPRLKSLAGKGQNKPRVLIFDGSAVLDRAYDDAFSTRGEILFMSSLGLSQKVFPRTFRKLDQSRFSSSFRVRELVDDGKDGRAYASRVSSSFRTVRLIPRKLLPFEADIGIFGNTVLISSVQKEYFTIGIESEEIARTFRTLYGLMWNVSRAPSASS